MTVGAIFTSRGRGTGSARPQAPGCDTQPFCVLSLHLQAWSPGTQPPRGAQSDTKCANVGAFLTSRGPQAQRATWGLLYAGLTNGGRRLQLTFDTSSQLPEVRLCSGRNRNGIALLRHGHRVLVNACYAELQMKVRAG